VGTYIVHILEPLFILRFPLFRCEINGQNMVPGLYNFSESLHFPAMVCNKRFGCGVRHVACYVRNGLGAV